MLALLTSFDDSRVELGVTEMAASLGVHKSTASRLAGALERAGLLTRSGRRFRLGLEVIRLGTLALRSLDFVASMQPAMDKLSRETGETVNLAVPDGPDVLNVAELPSTFILNSSGGWIGRRTTPHAAANGKVLLAYGAIPVPGELNRYTAQTITSREALSAELDAVRRSGYATAVAELEDELVAVASPVFDSAGACVAALSVSGPAFRMQPGSLDKLGRLCADVSRAGASRAGRPPRPPVVTGQPAYLDLPMGRFLELLAGPDPAPSGGGAAALAVSLGAGLCAMAARLSAGQLAAGEAADLTAQAERIAVTAASLVQADADSYRGVLAAQRAPGGPDGESRRRQIAAALSDAAAVPMEMVELAVPVTRIGARLAAAGHPNLRGDAITGALLAEAGGRAAAVLVGINLAAAPSDDRPARAARLVDELASLAGAAARSAPARRYP